MTESFDVHVFAGRDGHTKAAVTLSDGTRTRPVHVTPGTLRALLALARRASEPEWIPRPRIGRWPTVARLIERDGYVSQETFCREMGGTTPMAGWYLARMVRLGKLVRVGRCMYEIAKKSEAAE